LSRARALRPRVTDSVGIAPLYVSDLTAPIAVGLEPRQFRAFVAESGVPHVKRGHRILVATEKLRAALERAEQTSDAASANSGTVEPSTTAGDESNLTADELLARLGRRRVAGGQP